MKNIISNQGKNKATSIITTVPTHFLADELAKRGEVEDYILTETAVLRLCVGEKDVVLEGPLRILIVK